MWYYNADHPLRKYFSGITEQTFAGDLGVADPPLIDYLSLLLARFVHVDAIHRLQAAGKDLEQVADFLMAAEALPPGGRTSREVHRHIGDFTLFWTGLFPEAVRRAETGWAKDSVVSYTLQGKRSYLIAATFEADEYREESAVLKRLGSEFELCAVGLNRVRRELDELHSDGESGRRLGG